VTFKPAGADENGKFGTRVEKRLPEVFNPKGYGSGTITSAAIQAAIDAASAAGGGIVQFPAGTFTCNVQIKTNVTLAGAGVGATVLRAAASSSTAVITVPNFATLTGTNSNSGEKQFAIRDLSVDGNRGNSATGRGIALYGYHYDIDDVDVYGCGSDGFYSEWGTGTTTTEGMEATLSKMHVHDNTGNGFVWAGPHDAQIGQVVTWYNGGTPSPNAQGGIGFWIKGNSSSSLFDRCHAYGPHNQSWKLEGSAQLNSCQGEGAATQIQLLHNDAVIIGGLYFASGPVASPVGIDIGSTGGGAVSVAGTNINTRVVGCTGGAVKFTNSSGANIIRIGAYQTSGPFSVGASNIFDRVDLHCSGQSANANSGGSIQHSHYTFGVRIDDLPTSGLWLAHRGAGKWHTTPSDMMAPENSFSAWGVAYKAGASILELDAQHTDDDVMVAMHDSTVDRTTQGIGNVSDYPAHALPLIDMRESCGNGWTPEPIPTIEEVLERFGGKVVISIEPKVVTDVGALASLIHRMGLTQSVFLQSDIANIATAGASIVAAGIKLHVFNCTTVANVTTADAAGAWLLELPYNVASDRMTAALAGANIKRVIAASMFRRTEKAAMTSGFHGYASDAPLYMERSDSRINIAAELAAQKVGGGWYYTTTSVAQPALTPAGIQTGYESLNLGRNVMLGSLSGVKSATYSVTFNVTFGAVPAGETNTRTNIRVCAPSDEGTGYDADTRGYVIRLQKNGQMLLQTAPVGYGAPTTIGTVATTAIPDAGGTAVIRVDVTATTVGLTRVDTSQSLSPVSNTDWRGDYIWIGGTLNGVTIHDMVFTGVAIS
jgi:hypothetical protein